MSEIGTTETFHDDRSHYEISLTAGQAFVAFVLLLLSLAASFAFGLMIGRGQADERLVVRKEPAVINEGSALPKKDAGRIVDLDDFKSPAATTASAATPTPAAPAISEEAPAAMTQPLTAPLTAPQSAPVPRTIVPAAVTPLAVPATLHPTVPAYAQILSTTDQKTADALAAKLIDHGYMGAYVERTATEKGTAFRVRVRFSSEAEARAAEGKLKEFSKDVWITTK
jgi:hypothetical protein